MVRVKCADASAHATTLFDEHSQTIYIPGIVVEPVMSGTIEALHIYDEHNKPILSHVYASRPLSASQLLPLYLAQPAPRPSLIYLPNTNPPTVVFSIIQSNVLVLLTSSTELEPLLALEFLHRIVDIFEEFLGPPLLSSKIESSYDVLAQLLSEMCDAGSINTTESNAMRDLVEVEGWASKFLSSINIPGKPGFAAGSASSSNMPGISSSGLATNTPSLPWRRANVRHTSNELYVDIVESLSVTLAPSGRPLAAFANGTIAFTSKISGVPDLLLMLSTPSGKHNLPNVMELPVFHPCVRLARWRDNPGELSFIPPDGRFNLAGYEVDLLPFTSGKAPNMSANLKLPIHIEVETSLGPVGADFEVRVMLSKISGATGNSSSLGSSVRPGGNLGRGGSGFGNANGSTSSPLLEDLTISVPLSEEIKTLSDVRSSRGDVTYNPGDATLEWHIPAKETSGGVATLRCTVVASSQDEDLDVDGNGFSLEKADYDYNENETVYQAAPAAAAQTITDNSHDIRDEKRVARNKILMPSSTRVSFSVKGWLPSGIKVESLTVDTKKSRGLGDGIKPYKGVKYLTVSRGGVEIRC